MPEIRDGVHPSHEVIRQWEGRYCIDCGEMTPAALARPCPGNPMMEGASHGKREAG